MFDLWYSEEPNKRWTAMHFTVDAGKFEAKFEFDDLERPDEDDDDRRERILRARYGDKPIVYPPPPPGMTSYRPGP